MTASDTLWLVIEGGLDKRRVFTSERVLFSWFNGQITGQELNSLMWWVRESKQGDWKVFGDRVIIRVSHQRPATCSGADDRVVAEHEDYVDRLLDDKEDLSDRLAVLREVLTDSVNQLEKTKGGYYIYRFDLETMHRIADAIGTEYTRPALATFTPSELPGLIRE